MYQSVKALVLREVKYKEADKILTILTEEGRTMTVRAGGALRKTCRYGAEAQMLCYSEMTLFGTRGRWALREAAMI